VVGYPRRKPEFTIPIWWVAIGHKDLDGDGTNEIMVPRDEVLLIWHMDGTLVRKHAFSRA